MENKYLAKIGYLLLKGTLYAVEGAIITSDVLLKGKSLDQIAKENPHFHISKSEDKNSKSLENIN